MYRLFGNAGSLDYVTLNGMCAWLCVSCGMHTTRHT